VTVAQTRNGVVISTASFPDGLGHVSHLAWMNSLANLVSHPSALS
jgi:hypothetical protein